MFQTKEIQQFFPNILPAVYNLPFHCKTINFWTFSSSYTLYLMPQAHLRHLHFLLF